MQASSHAGKGLARRRSSRTLGLFAPMPGVYWPQANPPGYMQQPNALPRGMFTALLNSALQPANAAVSTGPVHSQPWLSADVGHVAHHCMEQTGRPKQLQHCATAAPDGDNTAPQQCNQHSVAAQPWSHMQPNLAARSPQQPPQQTLYAADNAQGKYNLLL